ncbi:MAG: type IV pilus modification protein PilV [Gammaproteobacteria bacterium]
MLAIRKGGGGPAGQFGVGMIEVLVAVLVLSIALLGLARLQIESLRSNTNAFFRSQAITLAASLSERLRANRQAARAGAYRIGPAERPPAGPACLPHDPCSEEQLAAADLRHWRQRIAMLLPAGHGAVQSRGHDLLVTIYWDGRRTGATSFGCGKSPRTDLECFKLEIGP